MKGVAAKIGNGTDVFRRVCELDLEGVVAKKISDPYDPAIARWFKILNSSYSQRGNREYLRKSRG